MHNPIVDATLLFCQARGLDCDPERADQLAGYLALLRQMNRTMNLIGPLDEERALRELILDSLTAAQAMRPTGRILDIGAGAGLPGLPLKILCPECPITLIEPRQKRANFMRIAVNRLGLRDVTVIDARLEAVPVDPHDYVISKAFQPPLQWLETARPWVAPAGHVVCMTRPQEREGLEDKARTLGMSLRGEASPPEPDRVILAFGRDAHG